MAFTLLNKRHKEMFAGNQAVETIPRWSSNNEHQAVSERREPFIEVYASEAMFIVSHSLQVRELSTKLRQCHLNVFE